MPAATREGEVRSFVLRLLQELGGRVQPIGSEVWQAELPQTSAETADLPSHLRFTFSPECVAPGIELAVVGSPFVDQLVQIALRQDGVGCFVVCDSGLRRCLERIGRWDPWGEEDQATGELPDDARRLLKRAATFRCRNARQRLVGRRLLLHRLACFYFRVALRSDERRELLVGVAVDPVTEEAGEAPTLQGAVSLPLPFGAGSVPRPAKGIREARSVGAAGSRGGALGNGVAEGRGVGGRSYIWERLYRRACEDLEVRVQPALAAFRDEARERSARDERRLDAYYRGLAAELVDPLRLIFRRVARAEVHAGLAASSHGVTRLEERTEQLRAAVRRLEARQRSRLQALEEERERRISELRERYDVRVEVRLVQAAILHVPRIEWRLRLNGPSRRELILLHDITRNRLLDASCDGCGKIPADFYLCVCKACICEHCGPECPACGAAIDGWPSSAATSANAKG